MHRDVAVEPSELRAAARQHDAALLDVGRQAGGRLPHDVSDRAGDHAQRRLDGFQHRVGRDLLTVHRRDQRFLQRDGGADSDLHGFRSTLVDRKSPRDRPVQVVSADRERMLDDGPRARDDGDLGRGRAELADRARPDLGDRQSRPHRSGKRLVDQPDLARARGDRGLGDRATLARGDRRGDRDDHVRPEQARPSVRLPDELVKGALVVRPFVDDHALALDVDPHGRRAEVDADLAGEHHS